MTAKKASVWVKVVLGLGMMVGLLSTATGCDEGLYGSSGYEYGGYYNEYGDDYASDAIETYLGNFVVY